MGRQAVLDFGSPQQGKQQPMTMHNIILTGFMATGKSTVGKLLAERLGYSFVDTDELIAARSGMSVAAIFREKGEAAFRRMESEVARELGEQTGLVVSTGGSLMLNPKNAAALGRRGHVFCLSAAPEEIYARVSKETQAHRPLLDTPDPLDRIVALMAEREEGYSRFPKLVTSGKRPEDIAAELTAMLPTDPD